MRFLLVLIVILGLRSGPDLAAEEEPGVRCVLNALRFGKDARLLKMYDGLRRGLESARLGRVCEPDNVQNEPVSLDAFARRMEAEQVTAQARQGVQPVVFAFGDAATTALANRATQVPRVFVLQRYSVAGTPLLPLPRPAGPCSVIYADLSVADVGRMLRRLTGKAWPVIRLAWGALPASGLARLKRLGEVAGVTFVVKGEGTADVILHARLGLGETLLSTRDAARLARKQKAPLVSDEPLQFGKGLAVVVIAAQHDLIGRYAAEAARLLTTHPTERLPARAVTTLRVLVDLGAADRQGLRLPLPFLARASELKRGLPVGTKPR